MSKKKTGFGLRMAFGGETPSALERRLNDRLNNGTLTVRGAGMLSEIENQRRGNATQRYGIDTQAGTARMNDATQRYGIDTQAGTARMNDATQRYGVDAQSATARMNDATQRFGIGTQADTARYGYDSTANTARMNDATQRFGIGTQADTARYGVDAQSATARMNDATQRYGVDTQASTAKYGDDTRAGTAKYGVDAKSAIAKMQDATNKFGMNLQADTQRYGMDSSLLGNLWKMKDGGEIQPRLGLRNGGEIHAANGFAHGGFADRASSVKWLSPRDQLDYQAKMALLDDERALKKEQLRQAQESFVSPQDLKDKEARDRYYQSQAAHTNRAIDERRYKDKLGLEKQRADMEKQRFDREMALSDPIDRLTGQNMSQQNAQVELDMKKAQLAAYKTAQFLQTASPDIKALYNRGTASAQGYAAPGGLMQKSDPQADPYEAQERARLTARRNMFDKALSGHLGAGGFGGKLNGKGFGLRDGGEIHAAKGGIWGAIKGAVGMGDSDEEFAAKMNKGEPELKQTDLAAAHAARLKREGGTWGGSGGETARTVPTSTGKSFDGVSVQTKRSLREHGLLANGGTLQTGMGGDVPGTGKGDKIPAKYEPGEFVVSNDMLAAEPELRDHLRDLRERVLAEKGMTPEQADAKAIQGAGDKRQMRARFGADEPGGLPRGLFNFGMEPKLTEEEIARRTMEEMDAKARQMPAEGTKEFRGPEEPIASRRERNFNLTPASRQEIEDSENAKKAHGAKMRAQAATPDSRSQDFRGPVMDDSQITRPSAKDAPPVLQGATGKDVGFGITRFNVEGKSPLFTNMTDESGMRSNEALINRKPQSDTDRIAGDNLSNRFAQRADAEARMAQREAELRAEYQQGQVDNRAIASSERQRELLNEQRNLERKIPNNKEEAAVLNARIAALEKARLGEGENFGARENALALDQGRNATTLQAHDADNQARLRAQQLQTNESARQADQGFGLKRDEFAQGKADHDRITLLRSIAFDQSRPEAERNAARAELQTFGRGQSQALQTPYKAVVVRDENGQERVVMANEATGQIGGRNKTVTRDQVIAAAKAQGKTDPAEIQRLLKYYGVE